MHKAGHRQPACRSAVGRAALAERLHHHDSMTQLLSSNKDTSTSDFPTVPGLEDLLAMLSMCDGDVVSNVRQLVLIEATSPIILVRQERSVSALRRNKSNMRASMGQNKLE